MLELKTKLIYVIFYQYKPFKIIFIAKDIGFRAVFEVAILLRKYKHIYELNKQPFLKAIKNPVLVSFSTEKGIEKFVGFRKG